VTLFMLAYLLARLHRDSAGGAGIIIIATRAES
jgi:hypothetical protein